MKGYTTKKLLTIFAKTNYRCAYCGIELAQTKAPTVDHITPKCHGGGNETDNLFGCCKSCNSMKNSKSLEEFKEYLRFKKQGVPRFTEEQIKYLSERVNIDIIFPKNEKFYFETLSKEE